jgi:hypothetical protein
MWQITKQKRAQNEINEPAAGLLRTRSNKFITPIIVNGKVYVGTTNSVGVFGLLP